MEVSDFQEVESWFLPLCDQVTIISLASLIDVSFENTITEFKFH
jgi:hypothetical protein